MSFGDIVSTELQDGANPINVESPPDVPVLIVIVATQGGRVAHIARVDEPTEFPVFYDLTRIRS